MKTEDKLNPNLKRTKLRKESRLADSDSPTTEKPSIVRFGTLDNEIATPKLPALKPIYNK